MTTVEQECADSARGEVEAIIVALHDVQDLVDNFFLAHNFEERTLEALVKNIGSLGKLWSRFTAMKLRLEAHYNVGANEIRIHDSIYPRKYNGLYTVIQQENGHKSGKD